MFGFVFIIFLSFGLGLAVFIAVRWLLIEGVRDEVEFPLGSCDISMMEECCGDVPIKSSLKLEVLQFEKKEEISQ